MKYNDKMNKLLEYEKKQNFNIYSDNNTLFKSE